MQENHGRNSHEARELGCSEFIAQFSNSLHSCNLVQGLTHNYYRYPARFSPEFVRSVIGAFSVPGDTILDPFMGGGTTVVEALAMRRRVIGTDLNSLAVFVSKVKSMPLSSVELKLVRRMAEERVHYKHSSGNGAGRSSEWKPLFKNVPWWIGDCIVSVLNELDTISNKKINAFLRCSLLKTSQWALDCRKVIPNSAAFYERYWKNIAEMCNQMAEYRTALHSANISDARKISMQRRILLRSAANIETDRRIPHDWLPVKLVVTSPPYPGIHVLYHRWQVESRKETPVPFAIIQGADGHYPSYYTLHDRRNIGPYFERITNVYRSIRNLLDSNTRIVQLVSFANPKKSVNFFLSAMDKAGFIECTPEELGLGLMSRVWRLVPNRKWYVNSASLGKELLLLHRPK